jgi:predicted transcriptional regulator
MAGSARRGTTSITVPISEDELDQLDALARRQKVDRAVLARHLLVEAMRARIWQGRA